MEETHKIKEEETQFENANEYEEYDKTILQRLWDKIMRCNDSDNDEDCLRIAAGIILCIGLAMALYLLFTQSFIKTDYYFIKDEYKFNFPGFIAAFATGFCSVVTYYFLRVIANISDRLRK